MEYFVLAIIIANNGGEEEDDVIIFVLSAKGNLKACYRGFYFNKHKPVVQAPNGTMRYQCEFVTSQNCPGYIWVLDGRCIFVGETDHTHGPNPAKRHHLQVRINYIFTFHTIHTYHTYHTFHTFNTGCFHNV